MESQVVATPGAGRRACHEGPIGVAAVRKLSITGSTRVRSMLMDQCAPTVKHLSRGSDGNALRVGPARRRACQSGQMINYGAQEKITVAVADAFAKRDLIGVRMRCLFWQNLTQMGRLQSFRPESHRTPRLDDKRMLIGLVFINCNGL
ncbi:hypothetical protein [Paracoccus sp. PAMC 22219]|uniref:hypothetical protein n=1 Tax=Paracoccus sp. PAMC 22219 TaxID=1569209 RepID=UPI000696C390|nr:hypothetical protein [Paracoccus sp. PAMC 22219]